MEPCTTTPHTPSNSHRSPTSTPPSSLELLQEGPQIQLLRPCAPVLGVDLPVLLGDLIGRQILIRLAAAVAAPLNPAVDDHMSHMDALP